MVKKQGFKVGGHYCDNLKHLDVIYWQDAYSTTDDVLTDDDCADSPTVTVGVVVKEVGGMVYISNCFCGISRKLVEPFVVIPRSLIKKRKRVDI